MTIEKILQGASKKVEAFRHPRLFSLLVRAIFKWIINSRLGIWFLHLCAEANSYSIVFAKANDKGIIRYLGYNGV